MAEENTILYFWNSSCGVCEPLYDKLELLVTEYFPNLALEKINIVDKPEYRAKYQVFSSPLIILMLDGKEYFRNSGNVSVHRLKQKIERLYSLKFEN